MWCKKPSLPNQNQNDFKIFFQLFLLSQNRETNDLIFPAGLIPDAAEIHAARKRRQAARESRSAAAAPTPDNSNSAGAGADSIPIIRKPTRKGGGGSRLVRDEDDDRDVSDEDRISFTGK